MKETLAMKLIITSFKTISLLLFLILSCSLHAQENTRVSPAKKKPVFLKKNSGEITNPLPAGVTHERDIGIEVEYFKLDHTIANQLIRKYSPKANDVQGLRDDLETLLDQGKAELMETTWVRARSGQRATTESVIEDIYPTEYATPVSSIIAPTIPKPETKNTKPNKNEPKTTAPKAYMTSAYPIKWETRNVGTTLAVEPTIKEDEGIITLNLSPEIVTRLGDQYFTREGQKDPARGIEHMSMPTFYTIKDTTQIKAIPGNYNLLGIHTPHDDPGKRILVLLKADIILIALQAREPVNKALTPKTYATRIREEIGIQMEYISLEHRKANRLLGKFASKAGDAQELRDILEELIRNDEAQLLETSMIRCFSGQRANSESVKEVIYPTEFAPPTIPNIVSNVTGPKEKKQEDKTGSTQEKQSHQAPALRNVPEATITSASPTKWETRNVGFTMELEPIARSNTNSIGISLSPEIVTRQEDRYFTRKGYEDTARGIGYISMPTFYQNRITTQIVSASGKCNLLGILTPHDDKSRRILVLLQADLISR